MLTNEAIAEKLNLFATLLELHGENEFKVRSYHSAIFKIEKITKNLADLPKENLNKIFGKSIGEKIWEITQTQTFQELENLLAQTPQGILKMLKIKGLGAKRVRTLWQEAGITTPEQLFEACENNQIAQIKGFGEKIQETIKNGLLFIQLNAEKLLYAETLPIVEILENYLKQNSAIRRFQVVGEFRRCLEVIQTLVFVVESEQNLHEYLTQCPFLEYNPQISGVFVWRGKFKNTPLRVEFYFSNEKNFIRLVFQLSCAENHLSYKFHNQTLLEIAQKNIWQSENEIYQQADLPYLQPELREGIFEFIYTQTPHLIETKDLKGTLHAHSTYSDGKHTLAEMAKAAQKFGFEYLGITDHSQSAYYAGGLSVQKIAEQHQEIEKLNAQNPHFKIFKGIESDILSNGDLDYDTDILKTFDFVVASIHSNLNMNEVKATERLIRAIENPFTTIIGHPTGRLLLRRNGYPLNMPKIIDACASNEVALEINAHPIRLDLDWYWVRKALDKGVKISINADAHDIEGYKHHQFGILVARKAGLTPDMCLNCMNKTEIEA
ncbi:MAG: PHP domain-containing protein, partial [Raineya sp.]|nr:PHP domain-containing protein [Raineya sp.]